MLRFALSNLFFSFYYFGVEYDLDNSWQFALDSFFWFWKLLSFCAQHVSDVGVLSEAKNNTL